MLRKDFRLTPNGVAIFIESEPEGQIARGEFFWISVDLIEEIKKEIGSEGFLLDPFDGGVATRPGAVEEQSSGHADAQRWNLPQNRRSGKDDQNAEGDHDSFAIGPGCACRWLGHEASRLGDIGAGALESSDIRGEPLSPSDKDRKSVV